MKHNRLSWLCVTVAAIMPALTGCGEQSRSPGEGRTILAAHEQGASAQTVQADQSPPRIMFEETTYDFGDVTGGKKYTGQFKFTNAGSDVLKIIEVQSCCGAVVTLDRKELAPGESGTLKVEYNTGAREGPVSKQLHVNSNDAGNPRVTLTINARIVRKVDCQPARLGLLLDKENAGCPEITLTSLDQQAFSIESFQLTGQSITAEVDPSVKATKFVLRPKVDLEKLRRNPGGFVAITLTHPESDRVMIPFTTKARFQFRPESIILFHPTPQEPSVNRISVLSNYGEAFEIESTSSEKGTAKVLSQRRVVGGYQLEVEVTPPPRTETGGFTEVLNIQLKNGEELSLKCYVRYADAPK